MEAMDYLSRQAQIARHNYSVAASRPTAMRIPARPRFDLKVPSRLAVFLARNQFSGILPRIGGSGIVMPGNPIWAICAYGQTTRCASGYLMKIAAVFASMLMHPIQIFLQLYDNAMMARGCAYRRPACHEH
jgi:hypothetical protein